MGITAALIAASCLLSGCGGGFSTVSETGAWETNPLLVSYVESSQAGVYVVKLRQGDDYIILHTKREFKVGQRVKLEMIND